MSTFFLKNGMTLPPGQTRSNENEKNTEIEELDELTKLYILKNAAYENRSAMPAYTKAKERFFASDLTTEERLIIKNLKERTGKTELTDLKEAADWFERMALIKGVMKTLKVEQLLAANVLDDITKNILNDEKTKEEK